MPYARGKEQRRLADEIARETEASAFYDALLAYPQKRPERLQEAFHWIVHDQDNRPTITLRHRMTLDIGDGLVAADREFNVSQGYNHMQAIAGMVPVQGGTMVFYGAHISTDRVGGAAMAMKHNIGRKVLARQLKDIFARSRDRFTK